MMELEYVRISRKEEVTRSGQTTNNALWDYNRESIIKNILEFTGDTNAIYIMATKKYSKILRIEEWQAAIPKKLVVYVSQ